VSLEDTQLVNATREGSFSVSGSGRPEEENALSSITMRVVFVALLVFAFAACGGATPDTGDTTAKPGSPAAGRDAAATAASFAAAARKSDAAPSAASPSLRPLETPLPDGVLPDFEYSRLIDMTTRTSFTTRQIGLQVRGISPADAFRSLERAFVGKGYRSTGASELGGGNLTGGFSKGGEGGGMTTVVASGGTYVHVVTNHYDEKGRKSGFTGGLNITIHTP
jgi:hypothetical protein